MKRRRGEPGAWVLHSNGENQRGGPPSSPTKSLASTIKSDNLFPKSGRAASTFEYGLSTNNLATFAPSPSWSLFLCTRRTHPWFVRVTDLIACVLPRRYDFVRLTLSVDGDETGEIPKTEPSTVAAIGEKL